jgi:Polyketide cyclase / dehydrase and lipid transport
MAVLTSSRVVPVPPETAAAVVLDWSRDPEWRAQVRRMDVDPAGAARTGQRIVEHLRFAGSTYVTPTVIGEATATRAGYAGGGRTVRVAGSREVEPAGPGATRVTTVLDVELTGLLRPLTRLLAPSYRRLQEADLDRLAALLAAGAPAAA